MSEMSSHEQRAFWAHILKSQCRIIRIYPYSLTYQLLNFEIG
jgi:hypothetical protein